MIFASAYVKILVNPTGLTAFCASHSQKSSALKFFDLKGVEFRVDFGAKESVRLAPTDDDKPKNTEIMPF